MQLSSRLDRLPPYLWAEMDRKIREKKAAGVDVISLGIGDPDIPTPEAIVSSLSEAAANPSTHNYPSNLGTQALREAFARFYDRRFGVELDPETEVIPALGSKECIYNLNSAFLDHDSVALASDPGYPVYTGGPLLVGSQPVLMPLLPELGFAPDFDAIDADVARRARLMFLNYPNNPTGAVAPDGLFERAVEFGREHDVLIVHDASYTETTYDDYVAPSFLETPGAKDVGVEVFSLSKGWNMTGWRTAAIVGNQEAVEAYWRLKTNIDSGVFEAIQRATITALDAGPPPEMLEIYKRRRDMVCRALAEIGVDVTPPRASIYIWAPVPDGHTSASYSELVLEESGVVVSPGSAFGPNGEGFFRISLTVPDDRLAEAVERLRGSLGG
jgi:LL-diaminopimelate aminotransferase